MACFKFAAKGCRWLFAPRRRYSSASLIFYGQRTFFFCSRPSPVIFVLLALVRICFSLLQVRGQGLLAASRPASAVQFPRRSFSTSTTQRTFFPLFLHTLYYFHSISLCFLDMIQLFCASGAPLRCGFGFLHSSRALSSMTMPLCMCSHYIYPFTRYTYFCFVFVCLCVAVEWIRFDVLQFRGQGLSSLFRRL